MGEAEVRSDGSVDADDLHFDDELLGNAEI